MIKLKDLLKEIQINKPIMFTWVGKDTFKFKIDDVILELWGYHEGNDIKVPFAAAEEDDWKDLLIKALNLNRVKWTDKKEGRNEGSLICFSKSIIKQPKISEIQLNNNSKIFSATKYNDERDGFTLIHLNYEKSKNDGFWVDSFLKNDGNTQVQFYFDDPELVQHSKRSMEKLIEVLNKHKIQFQLSGSSSLKLIQFPSKFVNIKDV